MFIILRAFFRKICALSEKPLTNFVGWQNGLTNFILPEKSLITIIRKRPVIKIHWYFALNFYRWYIYFVFARCKVLTNKAYGAFDWESSTSSMNSGSVLIKYVHAKFFWKSTTFSLKCSKNDHYPLLHKSSQLFNNNLFY